MAGNRSLALPAPCSSCLMRECPPAPCPAREDPVSIGTRPLCCFLGLATAPRLQGKGGVRQMGFTAHGGVGSAPSPLGLQAAALREASPRSLWSLGATSVDLLCAGMTLTCLRCLHRGTEFTAPQAGLRRCPPMGPWLPPMGSCSQLCQGPRLHPRHGGSPGHTPSMSLLREVQNEGADSLT